MATVRHSEGKLPGSRVPTSFKVALTGRFDEDAVKALGIETLSPLSEGEANRLCQSINKKASELQKQEQAQRRA